MMKDKMYKLLVSLQKNSETSTTNFIKIKKKELNLSEITIRRWLFKLEEMGYIELFYGKIKTLNSLPIENKIENLTDLHARREAGFQAASLVEINERIFVTGGETMKELINNIKNPVSLLTTNNIEILIEAQKNKFIKECFLIGGLYNSEKKGCYYNNIFSEELKRMTFDKLITSCDGIWNEGIYWNNFFDTLLVKSIKDQSQTSILVCNKQKTSKHGLIRSFDKKDFTKIIIV